MSQVIRLQVVPDTLNVILSRRIFWQRFDGQPSPRCHENATAGELALTAIAAGVPNQYRQRSCPGMNQAAKTAPAAARNRWPILQVLRDYLPRPALVLEIASGTGEHAVWFSSALSALTWQPTDQDPEALKSIAAWREAAGLANLLPPLLLDACSETWPVARADAVVAINMIHVAPWTATEGLVAGAARVLTSGGLLFLYGPFREGGVHTGAGNAAFDADLRARDPSRGIRDLDEVAALAGRHGFAAPERIAMPANNLSVVFRRR
jgi:SAM-dependent methyltransferase